MVRRLAPLPLALAASALGAYLGAWWVPFPVGMAAGALRAVGRLGRGGGRGVPVRGVPALGGPVRGATVGAVLGWALPLWALALSGQPAGATARAIAALAGLPPYAAVAVAVTLLLAALQVLAGGWLARAAWPRRAPAADAAGAGRPDTERPDAEQPDTGGDPET